MPAGFSVLWVTVAVDMVGFGIVLPILPLYAKRFHASSFDSAMLLAAYSAASFVLSPILGRLSDRVGRKPILLVSLAGTAVGSLITGLAGGLALLYVGRLVDGASGGSVSVAQASAADLASPADRPRLFGLLGAAFGVGFVLGPAIGSLGAAINPRLPFLIAAGIAGVNTLVAIWRLPSSPGSFASSTLDSSTPGSSTPGSSTPGSSTPGSPTSGSSEPGAASKARTESSQAGLFTLLRDRDIARLVSVSFLAVVAFSGFEATFALFGHRHLGFTLGSSAGAFAVIGVGLVVVQGGLVHPVVARLGQATTLMLGLGLDAVGLLLLAAATGWGLAIPALAALTVGQALAQTTMSSTLASRADPRRRGELLGAQQSAGGLARVVGPIVGGALLGARASGRPYLVGAVLCALALVLIIGNRSGASTRPSGDAPENAAGPPGDLRGGSVTLSDDPQDNITHQ